LRRIDLSSLVGKVFNRLTVIKYAYNNADMSRVWECRCSCGNLSYVSTHNLNSGNSGSCGCLQKEMAKLGTQKLKKYNKYDLTGDFGVGWTSNTNNEFYFDLEDYDKIKDYCWRFHYGYIETNIFSVQTKLHRFVMGVTDKNIEVDHISHKTYDNRKSELRAVTKTKNQANRVTQINNISGVKGVSWEKRLDKWKAYLNINKKHIYLGVFSNLEDAIKVRKDAEVEYQREYSYDNSMLQNKGNEASDYTT